MSAGPTSTPDTDVVPKNETAAQATARLFQEVIDDAAYDVGDPAILSGARPGTPVPTSLEYHADRPTVIRWKLPRDASRVGGNMFAAMSPSAVTKAVLLVPIVKGGRTVGEFPLGKDANGDWVTGGVISGSMPGGEIAAAEDAGRKLQTLLGRDATVRVSVFLPSGLVFAVGDRRGREAAVFLCQIGSGPGISVYRGRVPAAGELFTRSQLSKLFLDANAEKLTNKRIAPGGLD